MKRSILQRQSTVLRLCREVQRRPALYDSNSLEYQSKTHTERAWREVAAIFNESVDECRNRWKNIRNSYSRYLRLRVTSSNPPRKFYLAKYVAFIKPFLTFKNLGVSHPGAENEETDRTEKENEDEDGDDEMEDEDNIKTELDWAEDDETSPDGDPFRPLNFTEAEVGASLHVDDPDLSFLKSVVPDMKLMDSNQKRLFKISVLKLCEQILCPQSDS